jgi:hypothetical protein
LGQRMQNLDEFPIVVIAYAGFHPMTQVLELSN